MSKQHTPINPLDHGITNLPAHVAVIMDGNGRWAKQKGQIRLQGHKQGANAVRKLLTTARRVGVKYLTLYAFSEQNWNRPKTEVLGLMALLMHHIKAEERELIEQGIRFQVMGDTSRLDSSIQKAIRRLENNTAHNRDLHLIVALSYGGREELTHSMRSIAKAVQEGRLQPDEITQETIGEHLYTPDVPDPDLMIRTSGELRVSNFMLWQLAYTELYVTDVFWPDFDDVHFFEALRAYSQRQRRYGKTGDQIQGSEGQTRESVSSR